MMLWAFIAITLVFMLAMLWLEIHWRRERRQFDPPVCDIRPNATFDDFIDERVGYSLTSITEINKDILERLRFARAHDEMTLSYTSSGLRFSREEDEILYLTAKTY